MEIATVPTQEKDISMSETIESTPRTFTEQEIFGDDAPTTTPDAVSGPLISVAELEVNDVVGDRSELWTQAPAEFEDGDTELRAALAARESSDEEEADDSEPVVPMTLREARGVGHALKIFKFVQENQDTEAMRPHLRNIEALVRDMEAMTVSVRTQQTKVTRFFMPERAADGSTPTAGAGAE